MPRKMQKYTHKTGLKSRENAFLKKNVKSLQKFEIFVLYFRQVKIWDLKKSAKKTQKKRLETLLLLLTKIYHIFLKSELKSALKVLFVGFSLTLTGGERPTETFLIVSFCVFLFQNPIFSLFDGLFVLMLDCESVVRKK